MRHSGQRPPNKSQPGFAQQRERLTYKTPCSRAPQHLCCLKGSSNSTTWWSPGPQVRLDSLITCKYHLTAMRNAARATRTGMQCSSHTTVPAPLAATLSGVFPRLSCSRRCRQPRLAVLEHLASDCVLRCSAIVALLRSSQPATVARLPEVKVACRRQPSRSSITGVCKTHKTLSL